MREAAMTVMLVLLGLALRAFIGLDTAAAGELLIPGLPLAGTLDGLNACFVLLTALLFPLVLAWTWRSAEARRPLYLLLLLTIELSLLGTFLAQNLLALFVCWETVLIPASLLILVFGGSRRRAAAVTFFLYTLAGSVLLLAAVIALGAECFRQTGHWSFDLAVLLRLDLDWRMQAFVFVAIVLASLVKCPVVPFHSWLPLVYGQAPAAGTALLAGALSKMGAFALLKLALPFAPQVIAVASPYLMALAVASILHGALLAMRERDAKNLVAYASLSHMGYIVLGIFALQSAAIHGAMLQVLSHGLSVAGLFLLLDPLQARSGERREIAALSSSAPRFAVVLMLFILPTLALPLSGNFAAEFLILLGTFARGLGAWRSDQSALILIVAVLATATSVLCAAYMLGLARRVLFGPRTAAAPVADLRASQVGLLAVPLLIVLLIGVAPQIVMGRAERAVAHVTGELP